MSTLMQLALLFAICLFSEALSAALPFAVPSGVISMVLLFSLLLTGALKPSHIGRISGHLLGNMAFFFIPAGVGLIDSLHLFYGRTLRLIAVCTINTLITFLVTAYTVSAVSALLGRSERQ